mgnify:CR=1 FL=1
MSTEAKHMSGSALNPQRDDGACIDLYLKRVQGQLHCQEHEAQKGQCHGARAEDQIVP